MMQMALAPEAIALRDAQPTHALHNVLRFCIDLTKTAHSIWENTDVRALKRRGGSLGCRTLGDVNAENPTAFAAAAYALAERKLLFVPCVIPDGCGTGQRGRPTDGKAGL